ncbi:myotubularin-related protein 13 isoform X2 [Aplysia californica]|uniref:Myotubularin-related protein 13 isoform X2 n=1 Tax=Aplysia californica TaxID=6500 RepID=A0ABM1ABZ2_APLCA|nr:myotubularin-related protein 13 isoform X2 [Aplysia californica]
MSRLADYFVLVGYDHEKDRSGTSCGKILQRFPEKDWDDCPFMQGLPLFCQPVGWALYNQRQQPSFYVAVLTDMDGERHYCAVFTFHEMVAMTPCKPDDEEDEQEGSIIHHSSMFAPKSIALISRHDYIEAFRNCLGIIYTVHLENLTVKIETLVGNILGCVQVPPAGGPQVRFSIGAGDRQALQPALSASLPVSHISVAILFEQLGVNNTLTVFAAALTDHKILFYSESCSRLSDACRALTVLYYPLKYTYVFIPVLPTSLLEVLNSPTPFIAGVHAKLKDDIADLLDVIIVDLDGGSVRIPECVTIPPITDSILTSAKKALTMILNPDLVCADYAYAPSPKKLASHVHRDKELRSVFIRMFAEMFSGYRSSLAIVRIHPTPFITFHKAHFLGQRGMVEEEFLGRVIDSMAFSSFVAERGPPYRVCDIFDEVSATIQEQLQEEHNNPVRMMENIKELAHHLYLNECPSQQPYVPKVPKPTEGAYARIHQPAFPTLDGKMIQDIIDEGLYTNNTKKLNSVRTQNVRMVPMSSSIGAWSLQKTLENNARRLEVLKSCVNFIFDNKIPDARIIFPAVLRALKSGIARLALTQELGEHVRSNRAMLEHQQFDLVVKLLNCALMNDSSLDENGVAAAVLPLATAFCRKLCTGVIQFAFTCIQEHAVWGSLQFWEQAFYQDVQIQIRQLYLPLYEEHVLMKRSTDSASIESPNGSENGKSSTLVKPRQIGALEITAEQLRIWPTMSDEQQREMINNEESTVYSQAIHYAYRMVYLRVPLDASRSMKNIAIDENSSTVTPSVAESDSLDAESGFDETEQTDVAAVVTKFVSRFVDKVCNDGGVTQEHVRALHQMIPGVVAMHIETLEAVNRESKRLPPVQKPKIITPSLLPGEEVVMGKLRVYLLPDGREEGTGGNMGGPCLLPAEGAVFLTTYRIIFKGTPCDPFASEQAILRSFPVSSLTKEKKINVQMYLSHLDQGLQEGLQLRSNVFQLLRIAFDEEVTSDDIEAFRKLVNKVRNPATVYSTFAFTGYAVHASTQMQKNKEKNASLRQFAKRTLLKTARKAGLKKHNRNKPKYSITSPPTSRRSGNSSPHSTDSESECAGSVHNDDLSVIDENELIPSYSSDPKNVERLMERHAYQDYQRLGLGSVAMSGQRGGRSEPFRVSTVNSTFQLCRSYPGLLVVPQSVSDESIRKFSRCHRQARFPVITWRHPRTRALLLRASGFHSRGLMGMLKHNAAPSTSSGEASSSIEQEKYFMLLVAATPSSHRSSNNALVNSASDSLTSLDSLMMIGVGGESLNIMPTTPEPLRHTASSGGSGAGGVVSGGGGVVGGGSGAGAVGGGRGEALDKRVSAPPGPASATKAKTAFLTLPRRVSRPGPSVGRVGSMRERSPNLNIRSRTSRDPSHGNLVDNSIKSLHHVALYVLGEKAQMKGIKMESFPKCDFIPVDFYEVRQVKASFKKLMRACVPSSPPSHPEHSFHKAVEDSEWLLQLQSVLQLAGAIVDLLDLQGSSVMVCLEDGWDITTQVMSVAQVMMDPYYRTMEGFKTLIEKEWLGFGHRFSHRNNQTAATQTSGFAPIFLQFLDIVHQIHNQFPLSFEFSQYFLCYLAYHCSSNRFRTFMLDSELERVEAGWLLEERRPSLGSDSRSEDSTDHHAKLHLPGLTDHRQGMSDHRHVPCGASLWAHIDKQSKLSPAFFNVAYAVEEQEPILRPYSNVSNLKIWDFYVTEDLSRGTPYDIDIEETDGLREELEAEAMGVTRRQTLNACYHNIERVQPNCFWSKIEELHRIECDMGIKPSPWRAVWDRLECPGREQFHRQPFPPFSTQVSLNTQLVRSHGRSFHKRSTLEILVRGKMLGEAARIFSQPHRFEKHTYTTSTFCDHCSQMLWGLSKTGMRCVDCGYNCHDKCQQYVPKNCQKLRAVGESGVATQNLQSNGAASVNASAATSSDGFGQYKSSSPEHRTHEGHLFKQGALFKQWKQRWFVLDSMKHQLRYHESIDDPHPRGYIDLAEVESVSLVKSMPGAPKRADENSFIEIRAMRRVYNFMATDSKSAIDWVDKLQSCIQ